MEARWLELRDAGDEAWSVYADELQAAGDVRGELIRLELDRGTGPMNSRERELLSRHESLTGPRCILDGLDATWRRGFISTARSPSLEVLPVLLEHPSGALLDELVLDNPHAPLTELVDLVASKGQQLRVLTVRTDNGPTSFEGDIRLGRVLTLKGLRRVSALVRTLDLASRGSALSTVESLDLSARLVSFAQLDE
jgi:hypothetical protein